MNSDQTENIDNRTDAERESGAFDASLESKLEVYYKRARENPNLVGPWVQMGNLLAKHGDKEEAKAAFERALNIDPGNKYVRFQLEMLSQSAEDREKVKTGYTFSKPDEMKRINQGVRYTFMAITALIIIIVGKLIFFPSTKRILVNENHNSYPQWSLDGSYLCYQMIKGNPMRFRSLAGGDLYIADSDGENSRLFEVVDPEKDWHKDMDYLISPDGEHIAFQRFYNNRYHVCYARIDGTGLTRLEPGANQEWAPDGIKLAFVSGGNYGFYGAEDGHVMVQDLHTHQMKAVAEGTGMYISWSPDSRWIAYQKPTKKTRPIKESSPAFTDINQSLASGGMELSDEMESAFEEAMETIFTGYESGADIVKVNIVNGENVNLTIDGNGYHPIWLPNDSGIIFFKKSDGWKSEMWRMNTDGSQSRKLYDETDISMREYMEYVVSPNGKWIAFEASVPKSDEMQDIEDEMSRKSGLHEFGGGYLPAIRDIYIARTDGSDLHRLKNIHDTKASPSFSPSSRWVAYHVMPLGTKTQIWKTRVK